MNIRFSALAGILILAKVGSSQTSLCQDQYFLFGKSSLVLSDRVTVSKGLSGSGNYVELGADAAVNGNLLADDRLFLRERAILNGTLYKAGVVDRQNGTAITGPTLGSSDLPSCASPALPSASPSGDSRNAWPGTALNLEPGSYGTVTLYANATLTLSSGEYHFLNLSFEPDSRLIVHWKGSPAVLVIKEKLKFADRHTQSGTQGIASSEPPLIIYSHQSGDIHTGTESKIRGQIIAPMAKVIVGSRTGIDHPIYADRIHIDPDVSIGPKIDMTLCRD